MTDKVQLIKEEIKRQKLFYQRTFDVLHPDDLDTTIVYAHIELLDRLLQFIDSLPEEPESEDLEEEISNYIKNNFFGSGSIGFLSNRTKGELDSIDAANIARHFAEWQRKKDQETIELAEDHAMLAGMNKMKEEMMKDAVDAFVNTYENTDDSNYVEFVTEQSPYRFKETEKCKIIIVKEE